jgi:hypothetical protein
VHHYAWQMAFHALTAADAVLSEDVWVHCLSRGLAELQAGSCTRWQLVQVIPYHRRQAIPWKMHYMLLVVIQISCYIFADPH